MRLKNKWQIKLEALVSYRTVLRRPEQCENTINGRAGRWTGWASGARPHVILGYGFNKIKRRASAHGGLIRLHIGLRAGVAVSRTRSHACQSQIKSCRPSDDDDDQRDQPRHHWIIVDLVGWLFAVLRGAGGSVPVRLVVLALGAPTAAGRNSDMRLLYIYCIYIYTIPRMW